jgi:dipeptidase
MLRRHGWAAGATVLLVLLFGLAGWSQYLSGVCGSDCELQDESGCTSFVIGKDASVDGSTMTIHNDCCTNSRVHVVPEQTFAPGAMANVYYGLQNVRKGSDYTDYGDVIGQIPQVEKTHQYFHTGYPQMNEHQLGIAETTTTQKVQLRTNPGLCKQIMTIEQAQLIALQRCTKALEAVELIGSLVEEYGFLPSCCGSLYPDAETLLIADPDDIWILEVFSVGDDWDPASGKPGAVWAAQRVPAGHVKVTPNCSTIREINLSNPDQRASSNYISLAVEKGLYDPNSGKPFVWCETYAPPPTQGNMLRLYMFYSRFCPSFMKWRIWNPLSYYPFSCPPDQKLSVADAMSFSSSTLVGTPWDPTTYAAWWIPDGKGGMIKSPFTQDVPQKEIRQLLGIRWDYSVSGGSYGMVAQLRGWLPDPIGGIYWFTVEQRQLSVYVPIYAGVTKINPIYSKYNPEIFQHDSARWAIKFAQSLVYLRYQDGLKILKEATDPLQASLLNDIATTDAAALRPLPSRRSSS